MPTYNWLSYPTGFVGNGENCLRDWRAGAAYQTINQSLKITTEFKPYHIAVIYGKDAKRALILYDYNKSENSCLMATTESYMISQQFGNTEFNIQSIDNDGFTLAPTTVATESAQLWWLAIGDGPEITINCVTGVTPNIQYTYEINVGYKPMFFAAIAESDTQGFFYTEQRSTTGIAAAWNASYAAHTNLNYNGTPSNWGSLKDNSFVIYNGNNTPCSYYYFVARGD